MARGRITATIAAGATGLSDELDLRNWRIVAIKFPSAWVAADLSVTAASDVGDVAGTYGEVLLDPGTGTGTAVAIDAAANQLTVLNTPSDVHIGGCFIKLRSGPAGAAVDQTATRVLHVYVESI